MSEISIPSRLNSGFSFLVVCGTHCIIWTLHIIIMCYVILNTHVKSNIILNERLKNETCGIYLFFIALLMLYMCTLLPQTQTNTFQGILATDYVTSYTVFTYYCGHMSYSGRIGFAHTGFDLDVTHGASHRNNSHKISCFNYPESPWMNLVYRISVVGEDIIPPLRFPF